MKKLLAIILCSLMFLLCAACALADSASAYLDQPSAEVLQHLAEKYAGYALEDYLFMPGTPGGDYGFALVASGDQRMLVGFHVDHGLMKPWRRNAGAVPQGLGRATFHRHQVNDRVSPAASDGVYGDDWGFSVNCFAPGDGEFASQTVSYHWQDGGFRLFGYSDWEAFAGSVSVSDSGVTFYDSAWGQAVGSVRGTVQRDIRYTSFSVLPKTLAVAQKKLTTAPTIPAGTLTAKEVKFTGGQKYEVYSAPDDQWSPRGGNGKATVSTNDWIQVFGQENGWILIQYAIDKDHMRFGYIPAQALPATASVAPLNWQPQAAWLLHDASVTDDPLFSQSVLSTLPDGAPVTALAQMGDWVYIESSTGDYLRGFVKQNDLSRDRTFRIEHHAGQQAAGTLTITHSGQFTLNMTVSANNPPAAFLLRDTLQGVDIGQAVQSAAGTYTLQGQLSSNVTSISFIPLNSQGNPGQALFEIAW